ncbi:MAG: YceI family protein [Bacteroidia bacterium]
MKKIIVSFVAVAAITAFGFTTIESIKNKTYAIDPKLTTATWIGKKVTGQHTGGIKISKGTIETSGKEIVSGSFEFDMTSITNTDLTDKEWNDKLMTHLKSDDFFSVAKNPTATFVLTKATMKSDGVYDVTGKLTIKGITNEITFPANVKIDDKTFVTIAKIMVDRTKFDIKYGSATFSDTIGDKAISDEFELDINIAAKAN